jgi:hypothetical protein
MTNEEMTAIVEKLQYQVSILGNTVDHDTYPVEALILGMNWNRDDLNKAHDIFERWDNILEKGGRFSSHEFEHEFSEELGISYQGLKSVVLAFYRNSQWTNVCEAYVDSMGAHPAIEYHSIRDRALRS